MAEHQFLTYVATEALEQGYHELSGGSFPNGLGEAKAIGVFELKNLNRHGAIVVVKLPILPTDLEQFFSRVR